MTMMDVPQSYTTPELAEYQERVIGPLSGILGLHVADGAFTESVRATLLAYGVDDAAQADDIPLLRAYAEREAWRLVRDHAVAMYDLRTPDGEGLSRSQVYRQATERLYNAERTVAVLSGAAAPRVHTVRRMPDPYRRAADERDI
jgi:hypothetical protein